MAKGSIGMAKGSIGKSVVWVLMGMLILGLGGFGITGFSSGVRAVGSVGDEEISLDEYARTLQQELRALEAQTGQPMDFATAQKFGLDRMVIGQLIAKAALDSEADRIGLSVGDATLAKQIHGIPAFQGPSGSFDRDTYKFALDQVNMSEAEFENDLREETARTLLQGAVVSGVAMPDNYVDTLVAYAAERRDISFLRLDHTHLAEPLPMPTEDALTTYYQDNITRYTAPEMKRITYTLLSPDMVLDTVEVDEQSLRDAYAEREAEFNTPERRLVERLAFPNEEAAAEARSAIDAGGSFDAAVTARGLELSDVDLGDVARDDLGAAADAVFAAETGQVVGPFQTDLGPALFRVNGVLEARVTTYEDALPALRDELAADRAARYIQSKAADIDQLLAGGATLEQVAEETEMELGTVNWHRDTGEGVAGYTAFRDAAAALTADDYPEIITLDDDGIVAMRLEKMIEPRIRPLDEVRDQVIAGWESDETERRLTAQAEAIAERIREGATMAGEAAANGLELVTAEGQLRGQQPLGTPIAMMAQVFDMQPGELAVSPGLGSVVLVQLDAVNGPDESNPRVAALRASLEEEATTGLAQDLYDAYANQIREAAGVTLDQAALNAVHANFR